MKPLRAALQFGIALLGICIGIVLTPACASNECECPAPRPIVQGEFTGSHLTSTGKPPAGFESVKLEQILIQDNSVTVKYRAAEQAGSAIFNIVRKHDR
jgi:hypothetical protein